MIQFLKSILGLGSSKLYNEINTKPTASIKSVEENKTNLDINNVLPYLISEKTREFNLKDQLISVFYERENIYGKVFITNVMLGNDFDILHINTADKEVDFFEMLEENAIKNFDNHEEPFIFWEPTDGSYPFKILSTKISAFSSEKILSKKHMMEAHKMLGSDKLLVSIPRKGLIFICRKDLSEKDENSFLQLHHFIVLDTKSKYELLCEDVFIVEDGEITTVIKFKELSDSLLKK